MATYKSKYAELSFYVNGELKSFSGGHYSTEDDQEIAALDAITDAVKIEEPGVKAEQKPQQQKRATAPKTPKK